MTPSPHARTQTHNYALTRTHTHPHAESPLLLINSDDYKADVRLCVVAAVPPPDGM